MPVVPIAALRKKDISGRIERHKESYITLKDNEEHILYGFYEFELKCAEKSNLVIVTGYSDDFPVPLMRTL